MNTNGAVLGRSGTHPVSQRKIPFRTELAKRRAKLFVSILEKLYLDDINFKRNRPQKVTLSFTNWLAVRASLLWIVDEHEDATRDSCLRHCIAQLRLMRERLAAEYVNNELAARGYLVRFNAGFDGTFVIGGTRVFPLQ